jgi:hypothetical protein
MEDFTALAAALAASVGDVRGCLILSRDGLVLGAHPDMGEDLVKPAWLRFAALGEPERGFVQFGTELWCYVRRGAYAAFALAGTTVRPGLVIDQMEQVLVCREMRSSARVSTAEPSAPRPAKPRTPPPEPKPREPVIIHAEASPPTVAPSAGADPVDCP